MCTKYYTGMTDVVEIVIQAVWAIGTKPQVYAYFSV